MMLMMKGIMIMILMMITVIMMKLNLCLNPLSKQLSHSLVSSRGDDDDVMMMVLMTMTSNLCLRKAVNALSKHFKHRFVSRGDVVVHDYDGDDDAGDNNNNGIKYLSEKGRNTLSKNHFCTLSTFAEVALAFVFVVRVYKVS